MTVNTNQQPMTIKEMQQFIADNKDRICCSDAYYIQFQQALAVYQAIEADISNGSPTADTDLMIFTIGNKALPISCFNAETVEAIDELLLSIMQNAVGEIYLADPSKIV